MRERIVNGCGLGTCVMVYTRGGSGGSPRRSRSNSGLGFKCSGTRQVKGFTYTRCQNLPNQMMCAFSICTPFGVLPENCLSIQVSARRRVAAQCNSSRQGQVPCVTNHVGVVPAGQKSLFILKTPLHRRVDPKQGQ